MMKDEIWLKKSNFADVSYLIGTNLLILFVAGNISEILE